MLNQDSKSKEDWLPITLIRYSSYDGQRVWVDKSLKIMVSTWPIVEYDRSNLDQIKKLLSSKGCVLSMVKRNSF